MLHEYSFSVGAFKTCFDRKSIIPLAGEVWEVSLFLFLYGNKNVFPFVEVETVGLSTSQWRLKSLKHFHV